MVEHPHKELQYGAMYGPFDETPISVHILPVMTRTKQNSDKRCTIVDLSWPKHASVNNAVKKNVYVDLFCFAVPFS